MDSVGCGGTAGIDVGVGFGLAGLAGLAVAGFTAPGFTVLTDFAGLSPLDGFAFTLTGRGAALIVAARREAERRWAWAGVLTRPTPRRITSAATTRLRLDSSFPSVVAGGTISAELGPASIEESPIRLAGWKGRSGGTRSGAGPASKKEAERSSVA